MKKLLFLLLLFVSITITAQFKGIDKYTIITNDNGPSIAMNKPEQWFYFSDADNVKAYVMFFETNPVGLKHALSKIIELCKINSKDFNKPDADDSLIPIIARGLFDYEDMYLGISQKDGEIKKAWDIGKGRFGIIMNSEYYCIQFSLSK